MKNDKKENKALSKTSVSSCVFGDSEIEILKLKDESIDIICIDPPYLYLKNQKLNRTGIFICAIFLYICVVPKTQAKALLSF